MSFRSSIDISINAKPMVPETVSVALTGKTKSCIISRLREFVTDITPVALLIPNGKFGGRLKRSYEMSPDPVAVTSSTELPMAVFSETVVVYKSAEKVGEMASPTHIVIAI